MDCGRSVLQCYTRHDARYAKQSKGQCGQRRYSGKTEARFI